MTCYAGIGFEIKQIVSLTSKVQATPLDFQNSFSQSNGTKNLIKDTISPFFLKRRKNKVKYSFCNAGASFHINEIHPFATMDTLMKHTN